MEENFLEDNFEGSFVLDASCLPHVKTILADMQDEKSSFDQPTTIYIPEIIKTLILAGEKDQKYSVFFANLVREFTKKPVDIDFLKTLIKDEKHGIIQVKWISSKELSASKLYRLSLETFSDDNLVTRFSPEVNLLGELIGQILGQAELYGSYILMEGTRLITELKDNVSIFLNATDDLMDIKKSFFHSHIPALLINSSLRWSIGIVSGLFSFKSKKKAFTLPSIGVAIFDP